MVKKNGYEELYKKYRPRTWGEVVGQDKIVDNLRESVSTDRIAGAYLFSGPRGCGKTTVALILAKAINCENPDGEGNPCNHCDNCKSIDANTNMGVHYLSAANFEGGGVNDIKSIVDQAKRRSAIRKPIWIIDEIQRLSKNALDALLIPLEDPNMSSIFIFCTTEIDKIPLTITSRVQQRAFKLVPRKTLDALCRRILKQEGYEEIPEEQRKQYETEDAGKDFHDRRKVYSSDLIVKAIKESGATFEGGSARQTLSELDHLLSTPGSYKTDWTRLIESDLFLNGRKSPCGDSVKALIDLSNAIIDGVDVRVLTRSLVDFAREMIIIGSLPEDETKEYPRKRVEMSVTIGPETLLKCFKIIAKAQRDSTLDNDTRVYLEVAIIEMGGVLKDRMARLER
jgi:DNA polymerase-3 subunit gamma/tau